MADVYVDSNATGGGTGADWANAYTKLATAFGAKSAGDNFWVAHNHAESEGAAITLTPPGGVTGTVSTVICVSTAGSTPPVAADFATTAVIATGAGAFGLTFGAGRCYWYGITFKAGTGAVNANVLHTGAGYSRFDSCVFWKPGTTGNSGAIRIQGSAGSTSEDSLELNNCVMKLGSTGDSVGLGGRLTWRNTASAIDTSVATPTSLFNWFGYPSVLLEGIDLSGCASTNMFVTTSAQGRFTFKNCKFHATPAWPATVPAGGNIDIINSDSGATNYRVERRSNEGVQTIETTIVRTGGATDGTQAVAWKLVTTANSKWPKPFECIPMAVWNDTTGSNVTVTVYGVWGGGAVPTNADIWMEVSYLGSSAAPLATINLANMPATYKTAGSNQTADSSTWGGSTTKFAMTVTLSSPQPAMKGLIYVTVKAAAASSTFYIDPKPVLS